MNEIENKPKEKLFEKELDSDEEKLDVTANEPNQGEVYL